MQVKAFLCVIVNNDNAEIQLCNSSIFHNDNFGISVRDSSILVTKNPVFENSWWGVWLRSNSCCHISRNEVSVTDWEEFVSGNAPMDGHRLLLKTI
jgi:hypothetical protein